MRVSINTFLKLSNCEYDGSVTEALQEILDDTLMEEVMNESVLYSVEDFAFPIKELLESFGYIFDDEDYFWLIWDSTIDELVDFEFSNGIPTIPKSKQLKSWHKKQLEIDGGEGIFSLNFEATKYLTNVNLKFKESVRKAIESSKETVSALENIR